MSLTEKPELLHHCYVFAAIGYGGHAESVLRERGFEVHILNRDFRIRNLRNIWVLYRFIKKIKPDLIHTAAAEANFQGIIAAKLAGVPHIIAEEIGIPNHSPKARFAFRQVYRFADKVICISQAVKDFLVNTREIPAEKGVVMYNPVSMPESYPHEDIDTFEMVYVGRLEKIKNVEMLVRVMNELKSENCHLSIVGDGREMENLQALALEAGLNDKITFTGFSDDPGIYLSKADLFVLPSHSEGFGIAAVEAMFGKVPVLCTYVGGIPEFITDGENGWLFSPSNDQELVEKILLIMHLDRAERHSIGLKGYEDVVERFTIEKYVENLENLYRTFS